jgi:hypothetical protein
MDTGKKVMNKNRGNKGMKTRVMWVNQVFILSDENKREADNNHVISLARTRLLHLRDHSLAFVVSIG